MSVGSVLDRVPDDVVRYMTSLMPSVDRALLHATYPSLAIDRGERTSVVDIIVRDGNDAQVAWAVRNMACSATSTLDAAIVRGNVVDIGRVLERVDIADRNPCRPHPVLVAVATGSLDVIRYLAILMRMGKLPACPDSQFARALVRSGTLELVEWAASGMIHITPELSIVMRAEAALHGHIEINLRGQDDEAELHSIMWHTGFRLAHDCNRAVVAHLIANKKMSPDMASGVLFGACMYGHERLVNMVVDVPGILPISRDAYAVAVTGDHLACIKLMAEVDMHDAWRHADLIEETYTHDSVLAFDWLTVRGVRGDAHCFYRAVARGAWGIAQRWLAMRLPICYSALGLLLAYTTPIPGQIVRAAYATSLLATLRRYSADLVVGPPREVWLALDEEVGRPLLHLLCDDVAKTIIDSVETSC